MNPTNRDVLVLSGSHHLNPNEIEHQLALLEKVFYDAESLKSFCLANEVIDVNHFKIITKPHLIVRALKDKVNKPFVFISNKN